MSDLIAKMVQVIVKEVNPEQIVLFGSRSAGKDSIESDVDLLIIETSSFDQGRSRRHEMTRLWRALGGFPVAKDILVYSREEVERWRKSLNHVVARALREGRTIYERP